MSSKNRFESIVTPNQLIDTDVDKSTLLLLPVVLFELLYFTIPFLLLVRISLNEPSAGTAYVRNTLSIESYVNILTSEFIHGLFFTTLKMAVIATVVAVIIGIFYAYVMWRAEGVLQTALLVTMVLPLLTTLVVKLYSWMLLLAPPGLVNNVLNTIIVGLDPIQMIGNEFGVIVGLVYTTLPYASLSIYSVLASLNEDILEAARDLGANKPRSVIEVVIPQAMPGIIVASVITVTWNFGAYAAPNLLGSSSERTLAIEASNLLFGQFNWPSAAALSIIMLFLVVVTVVLLFNILGRWGGDVDYAN